MKKIILTTLLLILMPTLVFAVPYSGYRYEDSQRCSSGEFYNAVSVTDTNTNIALSADTKAIYVENIGTTNELYFDPRDGVAAATSTGGIILRAGQSRAISGFETRNIGLIASSAETTTAYVEVCY